MTHASLQGKNAIVTGAASGIGRAIALRLALEGCRIVTFDRHAAGLRHLESDLPKGALLASAEVDIADESSVTKGINLAVEAGGGGVDFLVNCAGVDHLDRVAECSLADWRKVLSVNLDGTFLMCRAGVQHMMGRGSGKIVNIASWLAKAGMAGHAPYAASKFAIVGLTQSLAKEVAPLGIHVNAVCPGAIDHTGMREEADRQSVERGLSPASERVKLIPLGRLGEPEDVAGVVSFLLSDDANYMTGQAINVTGGLWMN